MQRSRESRELTNYIIAVRTAAIFTQEEHIIGIILQRVDCNCEAGRCTYEISIRRNISSSCSVKRDSVCPSSTFGLIPCKGNESIGKGRNYQRLRLLARRDSVNTEVADMQIVVTSCYSRFAIECQGNLVGSIIRQVNLHRLTVCRAVDVIVGVG